MEGMVKSKKEMTLDEIKGEMRIAANEKIREILFEGLRKMGILCIFNLRNTQDQGMFVGGRIRMCYRDSDEGRRRNEKDHKDEGRYME